MKTSAFASILALTGIAAGGDIVFDQIGDVGGGDLAGGLNATQYFEAAFAAYDIAALDDFTLDSSVTITSVEMALGGWNGFGGVGGVTGWQVNIYSSPEMAAINLSGDVASADFAAANLDTIGAFDLVQFDVSIALKAGTYYVSVIPTNEFGVNGQTGVVTSNLGDGQAWQANPNGAFGFPDGLQVAAENYAFRLTAGGADCPWDLDGSDDVGTNDLILLLGSWGDPYGAGDLIELLGAWGPCE